MEYIAYIIVGLLPSMAIILALYIILKDRKEKEFQTLTLQLKADRQKYFLEPRVDAYQRAILLLERITPSNIVMRLHTTNKSARLFQEDLLRNIRNEFEHNIVQQLFIPIASWEYIKKSKEESIRIINTAADQLGEEATSIDLSTKIFEIINQLEEQPTEIAIKILKEEFQRMF